MATIVETKEGSWRAIVRRKGRYASKTFRLKGQAKDWARDTEFSIDQGGEVTTPASSKLRTFGQLIDLHVRDLKEVGKPIRRSKQAVLESLKRDLGNTTIRNLNRSTLITYGKKRSKDGAGPVTLSVDLSYIGTVLPTLKLFTVLPSIQSACVWPERHFVLWD